MTAVKLGILGTGIMGTRLLRVALEEAGNQDIPALSALWDPSEEARAVLAAEFPGLPWVANEADVIEAADCVYIASPPDSHLAHAQAAFGRNRAVLCEKPLSSDLEASRAFVAKAETDGVRAGVNFGFASTNGVKQIESWLAEEKIGRLESLEIEVGFAAWPRPWQIAAASWLSRRAHGGFTREVISHFMFLSRRQAGPLALLERAVSFPADDGAETKLEARLTAGSLPVQLRGEVGATERDDYNLWTLRGTDGALRLRDWSIAEIQDDNGDWRAMPDAMLNEHDRALVITKQLRKITAMVEGRPQNLATLREALEVQEIVEAMLTE